MSEAAFTLIDEGRSVATRARVSDGGVTLSPDAVRDALGWELKPEGLCRGDACIPVRGRASAINRDGIDLSALAELLDRPLAVDAEHGAAALGTSAATRRAEFASLVAPDFELPDLDGKTYKLSDFRGKKVLLVAYASW